MRKTDPSIYSVVWCFVESETAIRAFIFFSHYKHNSLRVISIPQKGDHNKEVPTIMNDIVLSTQNGELIGFTKPVTKTICEEFGIDMEDDAWKD